LHETKSTLKTRANGLSDIQGKGKLWRISRIHFAYLFSKNELKAVLIERKADTRYTGYYS
jgi:hypothetical protein